MNVTIKQLENFAREQISFGERVIKKFQNQFTESPAYAFEWSHDTFKAAARLQVGKTILSWLAQVVEEEKHLSGMTAEIKRNVINAARWPERSTSVQSNVMKQEITAVWAELLAKIEGM